MKIKSLALMLCLIGLASAAHASGNVMEGVLIDDGSAIDNQIGGAELLLTDDGTPVQLSETDSLTVDVASADAGVGGGCKVLNGVASIYGLNHGRGDGAHQKLAGGGRLNTAAYTAAMLHVPLGKTVEVTRGERTIKVKVNDRGPYAKGRMWDPLESTCRHASLSIL